MGRKDTGKNFENEIRRSLTGSKHIWWFRIQDTNDINRFIKIAVAEKQPADFFSVYRGRPIMLEAKTSRNLTSFPLYYSNTPAIAQPNKRKTYIVIRVIRNQSNGVGSMRTPISLID